MASRYKTTGCARFFFFLVFFVPLVYFGLKYFDDNGQLEKWREKLDLDNHNNSVEEVSDGQVSPGSSEFDVEQVKRQIAQLLSKIEEQDQIIKDQEMTIKKQQDLIDQLSDGKEDVNTSENQTSVSKNNDNDNASLEELLKEADKALKKN